MLQKKSKSALLEMIDRSSEHHQITARRFYRASYAKPTLLCEGTASFIRFYSDLDVTSDG